MSAKRLILFSAIVGSTLGGCVPSLWGAGGLSPWALLLSTVGGILGIWVGVVLARRL